MNLNSFGPFPNEPFRMRVNSPQAIGLIHWWPMVGTAGGNKLHNYALGKRGLDGTIGSAITWVGGPLGLALSFPGSSNGDIALGSLPTPSMPLTFTFWAYWPSVSQSGMMDTASGQANTLRQYPNQEFEWHNNSPHLFMSDVVAGTWHHFAVTYYYNGNRQMEAYVNGLLDNSASGSTSSTFTWSSPRLGSINSGSTSWFGGRMADVRIYNLRLTALDVWRMWQPETRWDLYEPLRLQPFVQPPAALARVQGAIVG